MTDVFAHRFVVETETGRVLADLGPKGAEAVSLRRGDHVELSGEMKPSELKVRRIARGAEPPVTLEPGPPPGPRAGDVDAAPASRTVEELGFVVVGGPRRKPKHFEFLGRDRAGTLVELHVGLDATLRKTKPVLARDGAWGEGDAGARTGAKAAERI